MSKIFPCVKSQLHFTKIQTKWRQINNLAMIENDDKSFPDPKNVKNAYMYLISFRNCI